MLGDCYPRGAVAREERIDVLVVAGGRQQLAVVALAIRIETAEHPLERARAGRGQTDFLSPKFNLRRVDQVRGQVGRDIAESEVVRDRPSERRSIARNDDVSVGMTGNRRQLD